MGLASKEICQQKQLLAWHSNNAPYSTLPTLEVQNTRQWEPCPYLGFLQESDNALHFIYLNTALHLHASFINRHNPISLSHNLTHDKHFKVYYR